MEIFENDLINCPARPAAVRGWVEDLGLAADLYQPFRDFEAVPEDQFRRNLVQRIGGYTGYGAANAPLRMAAQRQSAHAGPPSVRRR